MATADLETKPQDEPGANHEPEVAGLGWDASVATRPVGAGWDAEPLVLDWDGRGRADLLVTSGGGPSGRARGSGSGRTSGRGRAGWRRWSRRTGTGMGWSTSSSGSMT